MILIRLDKGTIVYLYRNLGVKCVAVNCMVEMAKTEMGLYQPSSIQFVYVGKPRGKKK